MKNNYMMYVDDVCDELGVSKTFAYKIIKELNAELAKEGFITIAGRIPRAFWETKFYGHGQEAVQ